MLPGASQVSSLSCEHLWQGHLVICKVELGQNKKPIFQLSHSSFLLKIDFSNPPRTLHVLGSPELEADGNGAHGVAPST